jgi:hypothetical protein
MMVNVASDVECGNMSNANALPLSP